MPWSIFVLGSAYSLMNRTVPLQYLDHEILLQLTDNDPVKIEFVGKHEDHH